MHAPTSSNARGTDGALNGVRHRAFGREMLAEFKFDDSA